MTEIVGDNENRNLFPELNMANTSFRSHQPQLQKREHSYRILSPFNELDTAIRAPAPSLVHQTSAPP